MQHFPVETLNKSIYYRLYCFEGILNLCDTHNLGNIACFNSVCLHINWTVHMACD